jgi:hypothetical protein
MNQVKSISLCGSIMDQYISGTPATLDKGTPMKQGMITEQAWAKIENLGRDGRRSIKMKIVVNPC